MAKVINVNSSKTYSANGKGTIFNFIEEGVNAIIKGTSNKDCLAFLIPDPNYNRYVNDFRSGNCTRLKNDLKIDFLYNYFDYDDDEEEDEDLSRNFYLNQYTEETACSVRIKNYFKNKNKIEKISFYKNNKLRTLKLKVDKEGTKSDDFIISVKKKCKLSGGAGNDFIFGTIGADRLYGGKGKDEIWGKNGNDKLYGNAGNDELYGENGSDKMYGGAGKDILWGGNGNDKLYGDSGNDRLIGEDGKDKLYGGAGNDELYGDNGNDELYGEDGNDKLNGGQGDDILTGGAGNDTFVYGENGGNDIITDYEEGKDVVNIFKTNWESGDSIVMKRSGKDVVFAIGKGSVTLENALDKIISVKDNYGSYTVSSTTITLGKDYYGDLDANNFLSTVKTIDCRKVSAKFWSYLDIKGNSQDNIIYAGNNGTMGTYKGGSGKDILYGDNGKDELYGEDGNDELYGGSNNDYLDGGDGDDILYGEAGDDELTGGAGKDTFVYSEGDGNDIILDYSEEDVLNIKKGAITKTELANGNSDVVLTVGTGSITLKNAAQNRINIVDFNGSYTVWSNTALQDANTISLGTDFKGTMDSNYYFPTVSVLDASNTAQAVSVKGNSQNNRFFTSYYGGSYWGGGGNDFFIFSNANGGESIVYDYSEEDAIDISRNAIIKTEIIDNKDLRFTLSKGGTVTLKNAKDKKVNVQDYAYGNYEVSNTSIIMASNFKGTMDSGAFLSTVKNIDGRLSSENLTIKGNAQDNLIYGGSGDDTIYGADGDDTIYGMSGNDTIYDGLGNDTIYGSNGNDKIYSSGGRDVINGGYGQDTITVSGGSYHVIHGDGDADTITLSTNVKGNNKIYGDAGKDVISVVNGLSDEIYGGSDNDSITISNGSLIKIDAGVGDDIITVKNGNKHTISGGAGKDTINVIAESNGIPQECNVNGGDANDTISISGLNCTVNGDGGNDSITLTSTGGLHNVYGGSGDDEITVSSMFYGSNIDAGEGKDTISLLSGNNTVDTGSGNDKVYVVYGDNNMIHNSGGNDYIEISAPVNTRGTRIYGSNTTKTTETVVINAGSGHIANLYNGSDNVTISNGSECKIVFDDAADHINITGGSYNEIYLGGDNISSANRVDVTGGSITLHAKSNGFNNVHVECNEHVGQVILYTCEKDTVEVEGVTVSFDDWLTVEGLKSTDCSFKFFDKLSGWYNGRYNNNTYPGNYGLAITTPNQSGFEIDIVGFRSEKGLDRITFSDKTLSYQDIYTKVYGSSY